MSDSDKISQDEIEELLRQAQAAAGMNPQPQLPVKEPAAAASAAPLPGESAEIEVATAPPPHAAPEPAGAAMASDDISYLLSQAEQALASVDQPIDPALGGISPFALRDFGGTPASGDKATLELLRDVDLDLRI